MKKIQDKPGGRPAKKRTEKQKKVVSTKLTELQYYAIRKRAGEAGVRISEYVRQAVISGRGHTPAEQAGCRCYPQAGRGSQQHQPAGASGKCRRFRIGGGGTGETQR